MTLTIPFDNSYAHLPARFYTRLEPTPVGTPRLVELNRPFALELGLDPDALASEEGVAMLAGNHVPGGAAPLAQVYAGHQFGGWSPRLGDGRAILLGEIVDPSGKRHDVQLKGSGPTPYSRMGDGRAWVGPVLREYIVSEAMHALGIPTTRALAAVTTGEIVFRETPLPGAVLTRVASSHIRVGTFQYFASQQDTEALSLLVDHAIQRHAPEAETALDLLNDVIVKQARLIARWMGVGFIHGVMNTDNMTISGETIDYGPCAFMDAYHPMRVFSSIDTHGRYAFSRQPDVALWNLAQLATALLPVIDTDRDTSVTKAQEAVNAFPDLFEAAWIEVFRAKIGLETAQDGDAALIRNLLELMTESAADFTNTFRALGSATARDAFLSREAFDAWEVEWLRRLSDEDGAPDARSSLMQSSNPAVIPRTHRIEQAISAAVGGDYTPFHALKDALMTPFETPEDASFTQPPTEEEVVPQTFCGT